MSARGHRRRKPPVIETETERPRLAAQVNAAFLRAIALQTQAVFVDRIFADLLEELMQSALQGSLEVRLELNGLAKGTKLCPVAIGEALSPRLASLGFVALMRQEKLERGGIGWGWQPVLEISWR